MGSQICKDSLNDNDLSMDPLSSQFKVCQPASFSFQFINLLQKIKKVRQIFDPIKDFTLRWYESKKYGFKLYGQIKWKRPIGQCLFYFDPDRFPNKDNRFDKQFNKKKVPVLITTKINPHYQFSSNTLIIYNDRSYYIGQIEAKKYQIPRATGKGLCVTPEYIYDGQFEDGYPQGHGKYRTKYLQYVGYFKNGLPFGQCIEKSAKGMFVGKISQKAKVGFLITSQNKRVEINEKIEVSEIKL